MISLDGVNSSISSAVGRSVSSRRVNRPDQPSARANGYSGSSPGERHAWTPAAAYCFSRFGCRRRRIRTRDIGSRRVCRELQSRMPLRFCLASGARLSIPLERLDRHLWILRRTPRSSETRRTRFESHSTIRPSPDATDRAIRAGKLDQRVMKTAFSSILRLLELKLAGHRPRS